MIELSALFSFLFINGDTVCVVKIVFYKLSKVFHNNFSRVKDVY